MSELYTLLLILSPWPVPVSQRAPEPVWQSLKQIAFRSELVGPHERWITDFRSELSYVRRHGRELLDSPPISDCTWLPPYAVAQDCRRFNLSYQRSLELRRQVLLHRQEEWTEALCEAQYLGEVWRRIETATCPSNSWVCRRRGLQQLREILGPEAYYSGQLPPCVPVWRFQLVER